MAVSEYEEMKKYLSVYLYEFQRLISAFILLLVNGFHMIIQGRRKRFLPKET